MNKNKGINDTIYFVFRQVVEGERFNGMDFYPLGGSIEPYYKDFDNVIDIEPHNHGNRYDFTYRNGIVISFVTKNN